MIRAIIVEDDASMVDDIASRLQRHFLTDVAVVAKVGCVADGILALEEYKPDLAFLDVHLPDGTSFDILNQSAFQDCEVIFITGFDNNALKAIKVGALDYLLKPIDDDEFLKAVEKALNRPRRLSMSQSAQVAFNHFNGVEEDKIILKTSEAIHAVDADEILYCHAEGNYTNVCLLDEQILVSKHIKKIEELLDRTQFIRCHQSYLVNKTKVRKFNKRGFLVLQDNIEIPVSGRRREFTLQNIFY